MERDFNNVRTMEQYQEDLLKWIREEAEEKDRRKWTRMQVEQVIQEVDECILVELEELCKKKGILVGTMKYYCPDFYESVVEKTKVIALEEIIEEIGTEKWNPLDTLRKLIRQKNENHRLKRYNEKISCDDIQNHDPHWFKTVFGQRFLTLADIAEEGIGSPRLVKVMDKEYSR